MTLRDVVPEFFVYAVIIILVSMSYLYLQADAARQSGVAEQAALFNTAATLFLFFTISGIGVLLLTKKGLSGTAPDLLSKNSSRELGAGMGIALILVAVSTKAAGLQALSVAPQSVFTSAAQAIGSKFWQVFTVGIAAPLAEEIFFGLAVSTGLFFIVRGLGREMNLPVSNLITSVITIALTSALFALFHVTQQSNQIFVFSAILFRVVTLGLAYADQLANVVPFLNIGIGAMWGAHLANNLGLVTAPIEFVTLMLAGDGTIPGTVFGLLVLGFFASSFLFTWQKAKQVVGA